MAPLEVRPRGIFRAATSGCVAAMRGRWRAILADSAGSVGTDLLAGRVGSGEGGNLADEVRLPREEQGIELGGGSGEDSKLSAIGDQRGVHIQFGRENVATGFEAILKGNLGGSERAVVAIAHPAGQGVGVALEALAHGRRE